MPYYWKRIVKRRYRWLERRVLGRGGCVLNRRYREVSAQKVRGCFLKCWRKRSPSLSLLPQSKGIYSKKRETTTITCPPSKKTAKSNALFDDKLREKCFSDSISLNSQNKCPFEEIIAMKSFTSHVMQIL